jgi:hypothetical protein
METKAKPALLILAILAAILMLPPAAVGSDSSEADSLVRGFPSLDELEAHLGLANSPARENPTPQSRGRTNPGGMEGSVLPVSARWFTAGPAADPYTAATSPNAAPVEKPLTLLFADSDAAQKAATALSKQIAQQNDIPINRYLLDRVTLNARTDYGTDITGLFVNGIGFGSTAQIFRQSYGVTYKVPLLQRYTGMSNWKRIFAGYSFSSSIGLMPLINPTLQLQQFLNNLQLSWSVSLNYDLSTSTLRKIQDGQFDQEAALAKATDAAAGRREELLRKMAVRIDALAATQPVRDNRLSSIRKLYPQFELYQARYEEASSCDEKMEDFFTLKGLALSLLTLADYDGADVKGRDLLEVWKKARFVGCGKTS